MVFIGSSERSRWGRQGGGGVLYRRDRLDYTALAVKDDMAENFRVRTGTKTNETNIVRVYQSSLS